MRKLVITLALTSVAFAGSTLYYAHQLSVERERNALASVTTAPAKPAQRLAAAPAQASATPATPARPADDATAQTITSAIINGQPVSEADMKKMQAQYSKRFLAQLADPEQREELMAERRMMVRNSHPRLDLVVGLSPEEYARFIELSALQQIEMQEASARCVVDPGCEMGNLHRTLTDNRTQDMNNLLGADRTRKLETYRNTMGERESVVQLRNRLPDAQRLSDDKSEALINALAEERNAIHHEAAQQGTGMNGFGIGAGMVFTPNDGRSFEERYAAARQNSQRLRDRAAQYLNAEQLRAFNEMQDETLLSLRGALRQKDNMVDGISYSAVTVTTGN